jgi:hypothetical protein
MSDAEETSYGLVVSFSDLYPTMEQEHAFVHGVEFGGLWERMRSGTEAEIAVTTHAANRTVIQRAAASQGWDVECRPTDVEGWDFTVLRKTKALDKPNPHGLRVVT